MKMAAEDIKTYPKFAAYVTVKIPEVARIPAIVNAIKESARGDSKPTIQKALAWGHGPMIEIKDLKNAPAPGGGTYHPTGGYSLHSDKLTINEFYVREFEDGHGLHRTKSGHLVFMVGVILLHELTHWANEQAGGSEGSEEDLGDTFETKVYGGVVN